MDLYAVFSVPPFNADSEPLTPVAPLILTLDTESKSSPPIATDELPDALVSAPKATDWSPVVEVFAPMAIPCPEPEFPFTFN